jgi:hypothetical protein
VVERQAAAARQAVGGEQVKSQHRVILSRRRASA